MGVLLTAPMPPRDANNNVLPLPPSAVYSLTVPEAGILHAVASGATAMSLLDASGSVITTGTSSLSTEISSPTSVVLVVENPTPGVITASLTSLVTYTERVSVIDFGADPTGTYDSTAAIQAAIDTNGSVYLPPGTYMVTSPITIPAGCVVEGAGSALTTVTVPPSAFVNFGYNFVFTLNPQSILRHIKIDGQKRNGTNPAHECGGVQLGNGCTCEDVFTYDPNYFGFWIYNASQVKLIDCQSDLGGNNDSIGGGGSTDVNIVRHLWHPSSAGNRLDHVGSNRLVLTDCVDLSTEPGGFFFQGCTESGLSNCTFAGVAGVALQSYQTTSTVYVNPLECFVNECRIIGGGGVSLAYGTGTGTVVGGANRLVNNLIQESSLSGILVSSSAELADVWGAGDVIAANTIINPNASNASGINTGTATAAVAGINVVQGYQTLVYGNVIVDNRATPQMQYAIQIGGSDSTVGFENVIIDANVCTGSAPGQYLGAGDIAVQTSESYMIIDNITEYGIANYTYGTTSVIRGNVGPVANFSTPAVPAASTIITNTTGVDVDVYVSGGTAVTVSINGTSTGLADGTFYLPAGGTINLGAYTAAPTWVWVAR